MPAIARIVVELALNREFDYLIPEHLKDQIEPGTCVSVPFRHSHTRGFVLSLSEESAYGELKSVESVVGDRPLITPPLIRLANWMAAYYCAPIEHAVRVLLPGAVRRKNASFREMLYAELTAEGQVLSGDEAALKRSPRQQAVLHALKELGGGAFVSDLAVSTGASNSTVRTMEKKGLLSVEKKTVMREPLAEREYLSTEPLSLMDEQQTALTMVCEAVDGTGPNVVLLNGVTGSGKTEVYLQAIAHALKSDMGAIVLVPEISLTPQTIERFSSRFGDRIAVLHSHLSDGERHDEWHRIRRGDVQVVVGARSAVFAPVERLGLIVVDEEHEPSYKQEESPRYNARDVAVMRGHIESCAVLLGSATPALESTVNARSGRYRLASMKKRVDARAMPVMKVVDMRIEAEKTGRPSMFSGDLIEAIRKRLESGEQTILFLNRRGYASSQTCVPCGHVSSCPDCSIALTYHKREARLKCHICGRDEKAPEACPECGNPEFRFPGMGTQRVESTLAAILPNARVRRMDADVTVRKAAYEEIFHEFRSGKVDILLGTQMIAKGLHFPNVTLIGVIYADMSLHMPDFRAGERTYQLLTQVAGRSGRGDLPGEVIVQTSAPFHPAIQAARQLDYDGFCDQELAFREELAYPPYARLMCITVRSRQDTEACRAIDRFAASLGPFLDPGVRIGGPAPAPLARAKGFYRYQLLLRHPDPGKLAAPVRHLMNSFKWAKGVTCQIDMDAMSIR